METLYESKEHQPITSATRAAAVVFGVHLSARAAFRLDRKSPATCLPVGRSATFHTANVFLIL
ncbi:MAG: hypothetical protein COW63_09130 [Bacteroidetes bacterium CG18_big_fil_WC_8_21_14_2_50_41_14]|nr:MAG: hypothetical protein COW63_09130 [Bacteroidetes bacterium CG18_big_fil_WC_8_21_14_2_50_41_14]PJB56507.1 MAG: hypothetical protein CO098_13940 [Bacteroidetes bacterium CG_4_9_14_3_um_filter_41_19]